MLDTNDLDLVIKTFDFWDKLSNIQKEILINNSREIKYKKGQSIFNGENECVGVLIVKSGNIRTYITSDEGREVTLYFLNKGDVCILSASCVLSTISFDVSVEVVEHSFGGKNRRFGCGRDECRFDCRHFFGRGD